MFSSNSFFTENVLKYDIDRPVKFTNTLAEYLKKEEKKTSYLYFR